MVDYEQDALTEKMQVGSVWSDFGIGVSVWSLDRSFDEITELTEFSKSGGNANAVVERYHSADTARRAPSLKTKNPGNLAAPGVFDELIS